MTNFFIQLMKGTLPETFWFTKTMTLDDVVCLKEEEARPQVADERNYVPPGSPSEPYQILLILLLLLLLEEEEERDAVGQRKIHNEKLACSRT